MCGNPAESGETGKDSAGEAGKGVDSASENLNSIAQAYGICSLSSNSMKSDNPYSGFFETKISKTLDCNGGNPACNQGGIVNCYDISHRTDVVRECPIVPTLTARMETGGNNVPIFCENKSFGEYKISDTAKTLRIKQCGDFTDLVAQEAYAIGNGQADQTALHKIAGTLNCMHDQQAVMIKRDTFAVDCRNGTINPEVNGTLQAKSSGGTSLNLNNVVMTKQAETVVRRLTPLECDRLQGFPDGWTDIDNWMGSKSKSRKTTDTARYKALGNSIALPPWRFVLSRLIQYTETKTMASLFDGIGGFPLIWRELGGTTVWTSEIEEFCCAVTKRRFG